MISQKKINANNQKIASHLNWKIVWFDWMKRKRFPFNVAGSKCTNWLDWQVTTQKIVLIYCRVTFGFESIKIDDEQETKENAHWRMIALKSKSNVPNFGFDWGENSFSRQKEKEKTIKQSNSVDLGVWNKHFVSTFNDITNGHRSLGEVESEPDEFTSRLPCRTGVRGGGDADRQID